MRFRIFPFALLLAGVSWAQGPVASGTALSFSRSMTAPLNAGQFFDRALDAWTWTFGKEPGAKIIHNDRTTGVIEATARLNFRSTMLTGREESMGTISYHVQIQTRAGECRMTVTNMQHTGNRNTATGGIHLKQLMRADQDAYKARGLGRANIVRLHGELRTTSEERIGLLLQAFEARIRAHIEP